MMDELFAEFQKLKNYLKELECSEIFLVMAVHLDGSGSIAGINDDQLYYYKFGTSKSTAVTWSNPAEGLTLLKDVLATLAVSPHAVVWY